MYGCSCVRVYVCVYIYNAAMEIATRKKLTWGIFGDTKSTDPESTSEIKKIMKESTGFCIREYDYRTVIYLGV